MVGDQVCVHYESCMDTARSVYPFICPHLGCFHASAVVKPCGHGCTGICPSETLHCPPAPTPSWWTHFLQSPWQRDAFSRASPRASSSLPPALPVSLVTFYLVTKATLPECAGSQPPGSAEHALLSYCQPGALHSQPPSTECATSAPLPPACCHPPCSCLWQRQPWGPNRTALGPILLCLPLSWWSLQPPGSKCHPAG